MEWHFARRFGLNVGYDALHFKVNDGVADRQLTLKQTMHGPVFGFGIYF
jgi:hypothetical protein